MIEREMRGVGQQYADESVWTRRIPPFDPRSGDHYWIIPVAFRVDPAHWAAAQHDPTITPMLDLENLAEISPPGCYHCERLWTPELARRRCKGRP